MATATAPTATTEERRTEAATLHFDLSHLSQGDGCTVRVAMREFPLRVHTAETLAAHRATNTLLRHLPDDRVTHYAPDAELPADSIALVQVYGPGSGDGAPGPLLGMQVHVPTERRGALWAANPHVRDNVVRNRLRYAHGLPGAEENGSGALGAAVAAAGSDPSIHSQVATFHDALATAVALVFLHPEMINLDTTGPSGDGADGPATRILDMHIAGNAAAVDQLNLLAKKIYALKDGWATRVPVLDAKGQQIVSKGVPQFTNKLDPAVTALMAGPALPALRTTKNDLALERQCWTVQPGTASIPVHPAGPSAAATPDAAAGGDQNYAWQVSSIAPRYGLTIDPVTPADVSTDPKTGDTVVKLTARNDYLRHLGAYVEFSNQRGVVPAGWDNIPDEHADLRPIYEPNPDKKYLAAVSPTDMICGIPIGPKEATLEVRYPKDATTARIMCGGLGTGRFDGDVCGMGIALTVVCEYAVPLVVLAAGAAVKGNDWAEELVEDAELLWSLLDPVAFLFDGSVTISDDPAPFIAKLIEKAGLWMFSKALGSFIAEEIAEGAVEESIPIVDIAMEAINVGITLAEIAETTVEVCLSPFVIEAEVSRTMDFTVELTHADKNIPYFPALARTYVCNVQYSTDATYRSFTAPMPGSQTATLPPIPFTGMPAGGTVKFDVFFYADNGWLAGQGSSGWIPADLAHGSVTVPIANSEIPLDKDTVYQHKQQLTCAGGTYGWDTTSPPATETITNLRAGLNEGHHLGALQGVTLAEAPLMLGYTWMASGLGQPQDRTGGSATDDQSWTFQNIALASATPAKALKYPPFSFKIQPALVYDAYGPPDGTGYNFFVDSRDGQYHLRRVALDAASFSSPGANPFDPGTAPSWGRFTMPSDAIAIHPSGFVVSMNSTNHKLEILQIPAAGSPDAEAARAVILSGLGNRDGLLFNPVAMSVTHDGRILVLQIGGSLNDPTVESGQVQVHASVAAFDVKGNPVRCFPGPGGPGSAASFELLRPSGPRHYLDLGVEAKGYVYVLSYENDGAQPADYCLDIYDPDGVHIKPDGVGQHGFNVARLAVSPDRYVYTLDFRMIQGPDGRTEPSVSLWCPSAPH